QFRRRWRAVEKLPDGHAQRMVPVLVETVGQLFGDRAGAEQIEIGEVEPLVDLEILIAQIASADNRQAAVGHYQLVVHASMLAGQVQQAAEGACDEIATAEGQRI